MATTPEELDIQKARAALFPRLMRITIIQSVGMFLSLAVACASLSVAFFRKPVAVGIDASGRVVPLVTLDKPYVTDSRVVSLAVSRFYVKPAMT